VSVGAPLCTEDLYGLPNAFPRGRGRCSLVSAGGFQIEKAPLCVVSLSLTESVASARRMRGRTARGLQTVPPRAERGRPLIPSASKIHYVSFRFPSRFHPSIPVLVTVAPCVSLLWPVSCCACNRVVLLASCCVLCRSVAHGGNTQCTSRPSCRGFKSHRPLQSKIRNVRREASHARDGGLEKLVLPSPFLSVRKMG
jgi:hypothetical protein